MSLNKIINKKTPNKNGVNKALVASDSAPRYIHKAADRVGAQRRTSNNNAKGSVAKQHASSAKATDAKATEANKSKMIIEDKKHWPVSPKGAGQQLELKLQ